MSEWVDWSAPDATGTSFRYRFVTRPPINVDGECPPLIESRKSTDVLQFS